MENLRDRIESLVEKNELLEAIAVLQNTAQNSNYRKELILLKRRFNELHEQSRLNLIDSSKYDRDSNTISLNILNILDDVLSNIQQNSPNLYITNKNEWITEPPPLAKHILGRDEELDSFHSFLKKEQILAIRGVGGIGKTTFASYYLYKYLNHYHCIGWIQVYDKQSIENSFCSNSILLKKLGIKESDLPNESINIKFKYIKSVLCDKEGTNILIIDNVSNDNLFYFEEITNLSFPENWHIIVTSREILPREIFADYPLPPISIKQCKSLFLHYYTHKINEQDANLIDKIIEKVDQNTLIIELLAKIAQNKGIRLKDIEYQSLTDNKLTIDNIYSPHFKKIGNMTLSNYLNYIFNIDTIINDETYHILNKIAIIPSVYHEYNQIFDLLCFENVDYQNDKHKFTSHVEKLIRKGWLIYDRKSNMIKLHSVIQDKVLKNLKIEFADIIDVAQKISAYMVDNKITDNPIEKSKWIPYAELIINYFESNKNAYFELVVHLSILYRNIGELEKSKILLEEKIISKLEEKTIHIEKTKFIEYNATYASILFYKGDYKTAIKILKEIIEQSTAFEEINEKTLQGYLSDLAMALFQYKPKQEIDKSITILESVVKKSIEISGNNDIDLSYYYYNLSTMYYYKGDFTKAFESIKMAIKILEENKNSNTILSLQFLLNLCKIQFKLGVIEETLEILFNGLEQAVSITNGDHPIVGLYKLHISMELMNHALPIKIQENYEIKNLHYLAEDACRIFEYYYGKSHPYYVKAIENLNNFYKT